METASISWENYTKTYTHCVDKMQFLHVTPGGKCSFFTLHQAVNAVSSRYTRRYLHFPLRFTLFKSTELSGCHIE